MTTRINGKYLVKVKSDFGFNLPGDVGSNITFWTDKINYENDDSITFNPINVWNHTNWPVSINIHMSNCVVFKLKE